jgi:sterol desaturase/sphingolipid hydroxylase (fatty acid hydroxylase superfamily)
MKYNYKDRAVTKQPSRELGAGNGLFIGISSAMLGSLSLAAILAYLYPSYLTTAELRSLYDADLLQSILKYGMWFSLFFGMLAFIRDKKKRLGAIGVVTTLIAFLLGGYQIPIGELESRSLSLGVDWLILSFLGSTLIFTSLEKLFPKYRDQVIFRHEWNLDFVYFCTNHLLISVLLLIGNYAVSKLDWAISEPLQQAIQNLPLLAQFVLAVLIADFVFYWQHRIFHETKSLWPFHAVHHSVETMDWLAGSRAHIVSTIIERSVVMVSLYLIGVDKTALDAYVVFAAIQSSIIHCNLGVNWGPVGTIFVTPQFHHWHHSPEKPAIDTNYSAHTTLFDRLFNTYHLPNDHWPAHYGTTKRLPRTFLTQLKYPFIKKNRQP